MTNLEQAVVSEAGHYRCRPIKHAIVEPKEGSEAAGIHYRFAIVQRWHPDANDPEKGEWSAEWPAGYYVDAWPYFSKRDGSLNTAAVKNLQDCKLWSGDLDELLQEPPNVIVIVEVKPDNKGQLRGDWINPNAEKPRTGGGFTPTNPSTLQSMRDRFGGALAALSGPKPTGPAPTPTPAVQGGAAPAPTPAPAPAPAADPAPTSGPIDVEETPF